MPESNISIPTRYIGPFIVNPNIRNPKNRIIDVCSTTRINCGMKCESRFSNSVIPFANERSMQFVALSAMSADAADATAKKKMFLFFKTFIV